MPGVTICYQHRKLFAAGGIDSFLLTTQVPLGELKMLRLWNDNSGLRDMGAWYVLGVTVKDVQTGIMDKFIFDEWVACDRDNYQERFIHLKDKSPCNST